MFYSFLVNYFFLISQMRNSGQQKHIVVQNTVRRWGISVFNRRSRQYSNEKKFTEKNPEWVFCCISHLHIFIKNLFLFRCLANNFGCDMCCTKYFRRVQFNCDEFHRFLKCYIGCNNCIGCRRSNVPYKFSWNGNFVRSFVRAHRRIFWQHFDQFIVGQYVFSDILLVWCFAN